MKFESKNIKNDSYCDAWELRRLYTFAFRRQNDAAKRSQRPRDRWEMGMGGGIVQTGACVKPHGSPQSIYLYINNMCIYFRNPGLFFMGRLEDSTSISVQYVHPLSGYLATLLSPPLGLNFPSCRTSVWGSCSTWLLGCAKSGHGALTVGITLWLLTKGSTFQCLLMMIHSLRMMMVMTQVPLKCPRKNSAEGGWLVRWPVRWVWKPSQFEVGRNGDSCWDDHGRRVGTSEGLAGHRWFGGSAYINKVITLEWACNQWFFIVSLYILKTKFPKSKSIGGLRGFYRCFLQYMLEYDDGEMGTRKLLLFSGHHRLIGSRHPSHGLKARDNRYPFPEIS